MDLRSYFKDEAWNEVMQNHNSKDGKGPSGSILFWDYKLFYTISNKSWSILGSLPPETESLPSSEAVFPPWELDY